VLVSTGISGVLGAAFWLLGARIFSPDKVAVAIAASSLLIGLASMSQINLAVGIGRYVPMAGPGQRTLVTPPIALRFRRRYWPRWAWSSSASSGVERSLPEET